MAENLLPVAALVKFADALREAGVALGSGQVVTYCEAVAELGPRSLADLYWAGRSCLVLRRTDLDVYDRTFRRHFGSLQPSQQEGAQAGTDGQDGHDAELVRQNLRDGLPEDEPEAGSPIDAVDGAPDSQSQPDPAETIGAVASAVELLRLKRFPELTAEERLAIRQLMETYHFHPPQRRSRRMEHAPRGLRVDMRRTLRAAVRSHGEIAERNWRRRRRKPRRIILLLDVSGSMTEYSRPLLAFANVVARRSNTVEVFCFGTRLTRVTDVIRLRDPDVALAKATERVTDWDGGTRIGEALGGFLRHWEFVGLVRGAIVTICSDGLETGDPEILGEGMERLKRMAHRVVWVNPLKGDPRYEPLARGMAEALPHIDVFIPGHNLASLESFAGLLPRLS